MSKIFLDTNILLYILDQNDRGRQQKARGTLQRVTERDAPVTSTQVLQEFYAASTAKLGV